MRKLVLFMHASLDGFVAGPNGEMDWISVSEELFDYAGRQTELADTALYGRITTELADTALYGRITFQMMEGYWPTAADQPNASRHDIEHARWYNAVTKVVISKTLKNKPGTQVISNNIPEEIQKLKNQSGKNILMFGSPSTAHTLMHHNLIDEYWVFVNPVLIGKGIPLFSNIQEKVILKLRETKKLNSGVVGLWYSK
jgi:dihydrofolate reductase